jgi:hypothetical protein
VVSIVDRYDKAARRLAQLGEARPAFRYRTHEAARDATLLKRMADIAKAHSLEIQSCAVEIDLSAVGIQPGKCIDDHLIREVVGIDVSHRKDKGRRSACGCVESREIGMYDSCLFGCAYCYATRSFSSAQTNHASHDPNSESLFGCRRAPPAKAKTFASASPVIPDQQDLFS